MNVEEGRAEKEKSGEKDDAAEDAAHSDHTQLTEEEKEKRRARREELKAERARRATLEFYSGLGQGVSKMLENSGVPTQDGGSEDGADGAVQTNTDVKAETPTKKQQSPQTQKGVAGRGKGLKGGAGRGRGARGVRRKKRAVGRGSIRGGGQTPKGVGKSSDDDMDDGNEDKEREDEEDEDDGHEAEDEKSSPSTSKKYILRRDSIVMEDDWIKTDPGKRLTTILGSASMDDYFEEEKRVASEDDIRLRKEDGEEPTTEDEDESKLRRSALAVTTTRAASTKGKQQGGVSTVEKSAKSASSGALRKDDSTESDEIVQNRIFNQALNTPPLEHVRPKLVVETSTDSKEDLSTDDSGQEREKKKKKKRHEKKEREKDKQKEKNSQAIPFLRVRSVSVDGGTEESRLGLANVQQAQQTGSGPQHTHQRAPARSPGRSHLRGGSHGNAMIDEEAKANEKEKAKKKASLSKGSSPRDKKASPPPSSSDSENEEKGEKKEKEKKGGTQKFYENLRQGVSKPPVQAVFPEINVDPPTPPHPMSGKSSQESFKAVKDKSSSKENIRDSKEKEEHDKEKTKEKEKEREKEKGGKEQGQKLQMSHILLHRKHNERLTDKRRSRSFSDLSVLLSGMKFRKNKKGNTSAEDMLLAMEQDKIKAKEKEKEREKDKEKRKEKNAEDGETEEREEKRLRKRAETARLEASDNKLPRHRNEKGQMRRSTSFGDLKKLVEGIDMENGGDGGEGEGGNGERRKSLRAREEREQIHIKPGSIFGVSLEEAMAMQSESTDLDIPYILVFLTDAIIQLDGCSQEGLFR